MSSLFFFLNEDTTEFIFSLKKLSEECCYSIIEFLYLLFENIDKEYVYKSKLFNCSIVIFIYSHQFRPVLSHICYVLLEVGNSKLSSRVKIRAFNVLSRIIYPSNLVKNIIDYKKFQLNHQNCAACFLPGFSQAYKNVVTGDNKLGSKVKEVS